MPIYDLISGSSAWSVPSVVEGPGSTGLTEINGKPKSRTFFSNPCSAAWSITEPVSSVLPSSSSVMVKAFKPVCPLRIQLTFDPDLIDHGLIWISFGAHLSLSFSFCGRSLRSVPRVQCTGNISDNQVLTVQILKY